MRSLTSWEKSKVWHWNFVHWLSIKQETFFIEKSCRKHAPKTSPDPFSVLLNNPKQPLHTRNYFKSKIFWKENYQKALKKLTLFFLSNPVPFNGQSYQKQKGSGTSDQLLFRSWNKFRRIPLFVIYYLTKFDDVM